VALPPAARENVDMVTERDVLSERGGNANHHKGNKRYRMTAKTEKYVDKVDIKYVDKVDIKNLDILSERGGKGNHHPGNDKYLKIVSENESTYKVAATKAKTEIAKFIVTQVEGYGGRFLKKDGADKDGRYFVMTEKEARKKTSQALRDEKKRKRTDVDVEEDVAEES
jgi:hypothetical protein